MTPDRKRRVRARGARAPPECSRSSGAGLCRDGSGAADRADAEGSTSTTSSPSSSARGSWRRLSTVRSTRSHLDAVDQRDLHRGARPRAPIRPAFLAAPESAIRLATWASSPMSSLASLPAGAGASGAHPGMRLGNPHHRRRPRPTSSGTHGAPQRSGRRRDDPSPRTRAAPSDGIACGGLLLLRGRDQPRTDHAPLPELQGSSRRRLIPDAAGVRSSTDRIQLFGIPSSSVHRRSRSTERGVRFVRTARYRGPRQSSWRHTHTFEDVSGGTAR